MLSSDSSAVPRMPAPRVATSVTSARPIISAAAVRAVRTGLRCELRSASRPAAPAIRSEGLPTADAIGTTRREETSQKATNMNRQPSRSPGATSPCRGRPPRPRPAARSRPPAVTGGSQPCRVRRPGGSVAPSRTAAIGGMAIARRAGMIVASIVIPTPSTSDTMIVRVASTRPDCGIDRSMASKTALRPLASATPPNRPSTEASTPRTKPSSRTERMICLRDAPSVRRVANSAPAARG